MINEQLPPHNIEAEQGVLGSILIDGESIYQLTLQPYDFSDERHQEIFRAMRQTDTPDQITVAHELVKNGKFELIGGASYLSHLVSMVPTSLHVDEYARVVHECSFNRRIINAASRISTIGYKNQSPSLAMDQSYRELAQVSASVSQSIVSAHDVAEYGLQRYGELRDQSPGIETGLYYFDKVSGGIFPGEYIVFAAETSFGKTTLALQIARHIAHTKPVLYVSLEMTMGEITDKNIASLSGVSCDRIARGHYSDDDMGAISLALGKLADLKLYTLHGRHTTQTVRSAINRMANTSGIAAVFVDYLHLLRDKGSNPNERIDGISKELAATSKEFNIPVIALAQFNRSKEHRDDKEPRLSDLRDSGALEQDANCVWFLTRKRSVVLGEEDVPKLIIAKDRRRGRLGTVKLWWISGREEYEAPIYLNEPAGANGGGEQ